MTKIAIIIPALNEEESIAKVITALPNTLYNLHIIVCDNGSSDQTANIAKKYGAQIVHEPIRGYGNACLKGISAIPKECSIVAFIDADYSDYPEELPLLIEPIKNKNADMVIGSRTLNKKSIQALLPQARFGNWLATMLIKLFWKTHYTDLGPFRAIAKDKLEILNMQDKNFGWTIEMQIKASKYKMKILEIPVSYRKRIGKSKISGTIKGSFMAGYIILLTIYKEKFINK